MEQPKIILLCNSKIALPALKELAFFNQLAAIIVPAKNKELLLTIKEYLTSGTTIPVLEITKENLSIVLKDNIATHDPLAVVMMTFPYIIPVDLLSLPKKGFINFHYGKLPQYRGPEPIFAQLIRREPNPGLAVHKVSEGIDTGDIIVQDSVVCSATDTYGMVQQKLADCGAKLIRTVMKILSYGSFVPATAQDEKDAAYYKKPGADDVTINWQTMNSETIIALANACNPWNKGAKTKLGDDWIGIIEAELNGESNKKDTAPGTILCCTREEGLCVQTMDGKKLKLVIIYWETGFYSGYRLAELIEVAEKKME